MLTFIILLNVLDEVLGMGNIIFGCKWTLCKTKDFQNQILNVVVANFEHLRSPLIVEQTPTALLVDRHRDSCGTRSGIISQTSLY